MNMHRHNQRGLSLISLMIALLIGTFLLAGLFAVWFQTRQTFSAQNQLAQVQDNQRMALIILGNAVQTAGYYPVAANYSSSPPSPLYQQNTVFTAITPFAVGQTVYGTHPSTGNDTLELRFMADPTSGNTLDCLGQADTARTLVTNTFQIDANNNLTCSVNGSTAQTIVPGIKGFKVYYGVSNSLQDNSVIEYLTADQMSTTQWNLVQSVNLQLTFANPLYGLSGQPGQTSSTLRTISRIVSLPQQAK